MTKQNGSDPDFVVQNALQAKAIALADEAKKAAAVAKKRAELLEAEAERLAQLVIETFDKLSQHATIQIRRADNAIEAIREQAQEIESAIEIAKHGDSDGGPLQNVQRAVERALEASGARVHDDGGGNIMPDVRRSPATPSA